MISKTDGAGRRMTEAQQRQRSAWMEKWNASMKARASVSQWRRSVSLAETNSDTQFFEGLTEIDRAPIRHAREAFTSEFAHRLGYS